MLPTPASRSWARVHAAERGVDVHGLKTQLWDCPQDMVGGPGSGARPARVSGCARENGRMGVERVDVEAALLRTLHDIDDGQPVH